MKRAKENTLFLAFAKSARTHCLMIRRHMTKTKIFTTEQFTPTAHSTAKEKAKFANHFADFALNNCPRSKFPKWFYTRLITCFGHIAEYNIDGFYETWFSTWQKREKFLNHAIIFPCYGQPEFTYCDVEKALIVWMKEKMLLI